jgi:hypothetical protein
MSCAPGQTRPVLNLITPVMSHVPSAVSSDFFADAVTGEEHETQRAPTSTAVVSFKTFV